MLTVYQKFPPKFPWSPRHRRPPRSPRRHWVLPWAMASSFPTPVEPSIRVAIFPDPELMTSLTTQALSPSSWRRWPRTVVSKRRCPRACNTIILLEPATSLSPWCHWPLTVIELAMLSTPCHPRAHDVVDPARPRARNAVILLELETSSTLWRPRAHDVIDPAPSSSTQHYIVYFSMSFWASRSWIWYATLSHCFDMLHCFNMLHIATLLLFCHIALICYIVMLLWYATYYFCSTIFWFIWIHTTLLNDESGLSEMSVTTWTNIIILLRFQLRTSCSI
jgi:hypothetical protein